MANLTELEQWELGVYQLETTDPVLGGADGIDNLQAKQLANRTNYLKAQLEANTDQATEIAKGVAEIATQVETDAGTDDLRFITPKKLKAWVKQATESALGMMRVATQAQTDAGADDTVAVTPKKLHQKIVDNVIGVNQTWQNVTSSRLLGVTYTNTTGKPILVNITSAEGFLANDVIFKVDTLIIAGGGSDNSTDRMFLSAIIPNGSTYLLNHTNGFVVSVWSELR